jgi:ribosomal protein L37AE/L43A
VEWRQGSLAGDDMSRDLGETLPNSQKYRNPGLDQDHTNTCPICKGHEIVPLTKKNCWLWACRSCHKCWEKELWEAATHPVQRSIEEFA